MSCWIGCSISHIFLFTDEWRRKRDVLQILSFDSVQKVMINQVASCRLRYFTGAESELIGNNLTIQVFKVRLKTCLSGSFCQNPPSTSGLFYHSSSSPSAAADKPSCDDSGTFYWSLAWAAGPHHWSWWISRMCQRWGPLTAGAATREGWG